MLYDILISEALVTAKAFAEEHVALNVASDAVA
jgi:hypothetical protein